MHKSLHRITVRSAQPSLKLFPQAHQNKNQFPRRAHQVDEEDDAGEGEYDAQEELRRRRRHEPAQLVLGRLDGSNIRCLM